MPLQRKLRWLITGVLVWLAVAGIILPSQAQTAATAYLSPPDISAFPQLSAYLDVSDAQGSFIADLAASDVTLLEDGLQLPLTGLQIQRPGVQLVLAITPGAALEIRDGQGISRYLHLVDGLLAGTWVTQAAGQDDFSLLTSEGAILIHNNDPVALSNRLADYQIAATGETPSLEVLAQALEVAADPLPRPGMERAVLYITPPQTADITAGLQTLAARANQQNIHIFVWLVGAPESFYQLTAEQLATLAGQTRGSFLTFSGTEPIPDLESYLEPLRPVYRLEYTSQAATAGAHQISAQVSLPEGLLNSPPQAFEVNLQPPSPVLVTPPVVITRSFVSTATSGEMAPSDLATSELTPAEQSLTLAVAFPDGYPRPLVRSTLIVDDQVVAENTEPPFDTFRWDLRPYTQNSLHTLRVEVVDSLGLVGQSAETVVQVTAPTPEQGLIVAFESKRLLVVGLGVLIAGSVLALVLIVGGRIRPQAAGHRQKAARGKAATRQRMERDPVTQPVAITPASSLDGQARATISSWLGRRDRHAPQLASEQPLAFLIPLVEAGAATLPTPLPLGAETVTLGSDPQQASLLIEDPSVEGLHARLAPLQNSFHLVDAGSVAGTWINYTPIPADGIILEHGDLVHFGRSGFRFTLRNGSHRRKPTAQPLEPPA